MADNPALTERQRTALRLFAAEKDLADTFLENTAKSLRSEVVEE